MTASPKPTEPEDTITALIAELDSISSPASKLFSLLIHSDPEAWKKFLADIDERGQLHPIVFDAGGILLAGRNRWLACKLLGREPTVETRNLSGAAATAFVLSDNLIRRHDEIGPRAIYTAKLLEMIKADPKTFGPAPTQQQSADAGGFSDTTLRAAQELIKDHPAIAEQVAKTKITVNAGKVLAKEPKAKRERTLSEVRAAKDKKEAKKTIKAAKPPKLHMVDPDNPQRELSGAYSTLIAVIKAIADLPRALRNLHKINESRPLAPTQAWDIKRVVLRLRKVEFKDLLAAAEVALQELDSIIGGAPDPKALKPVPDIRETQPATV